MSFSNSNIAGLILAGGQGSRMGGADKGLVLHSGKPMIEHIIKALSTQADTLIISANRNLEQYGSFGYQVVSDSDQTRYDGPMAGIAAGLEALKDSDYEYALISSCDTPNIPPFLAERLMQALKSSSAHTALAHDGQRRQNLHCLIKRAAWPLLIEDYEKGGRAMYKWQNQVGDIIVDFSDCASCFENLNRAESLSDD